MPPKAGGGGGGAWGGITGTLSSQTDLQAALDAKVDLTGDTMTGPLITAASASGGSGFRLPPGAAPSAPVDGDIWTETSGVYARVNGVTKQLDAAGGAAAIEVVEVDFTTAAASKFFDIAFASASVGQQVVVSPSLDMPTGVAEDELEMDPIVTAGRVLSAGNIRVFVASATGALLTGKRNINVMVG